MASLKQNKIKDALRPDSRALIAALCFSFFTSVLNLVPSIFMIQLSERVMLSRNEMTLLFLSVIAVFLIAILSALDGIRLRVLQRIGLSVDQRIAEDIFDILNRRNVAMPAAAKGLVLTDLNTFRDFVSGPIVIQLLDLFWVPLIIAVMFVLHPLVGLAMTTILVVTVGFSALNQWIVGTDTKRSQRASAQALEFARAVMRSAEAARVMGMLPALRRRWLDHHREGQAWQQAAYSRSDLITGTLRFLRNSQQIVLMVVAVLLYFVQQVSAGAVFAIVFISVRAITPVIVVASSWRAIWQFLASVERLNSVLNQHADESTRMTLPRPTGLLSVSRAVLSPPNTDAVVLNDVSFTLPSGRILGVVGPSGAGKSSLAKLLVGAWRPRRGSVTLDEHDLFHWNQDELGIHIGYVPQEVDLLPGTVAENIARFRDDGPIDYSTVLEAAELAGIQDIVQALPEGYNTKVGFDGHVFSGGQRQRIALARALYGTPSLIVLDEPNSNLDAVGEQSLGRTLTVARNRGATVVIVTHRVSMLTYCDDLLVMNQGTIHTFGSRDTIMSRLSAYRPSAPAPNVAALASQA
jgi:PrtD family type I secretion system ABC transporter